MRDDGSHGVDDEEREAEKEQGRQKRARVYVSVYTCVRLPFFYPLLACTRISIYVYRMCLYVCTCACARGQLHVCGEICICINANARVTVERDDGVNRCTLVIGTDGVYACMLRV